MTRDKALKIFGRMIVLGIVLLVVIQLIPVNRTNPPLVTQPNWDSPQTQALFDRACSDCHSNQSKWPFYAYIAPISWLVVHDVNEGREKFNVSDLGNHPIEVDEMVEQIQKGKMPMPIYLPMHPEAVLSAQEKQQLIAGLQVTFAGMSGEDD
jgi:mono/diheme cytochrome c family protein